MRRATGAALAAAGSFAALAGAGWLGLRVKPEPFSPHPERTPEIETAELPSDLPEPARRHFRATLGERVPKIETAVVWGRARFKINGLWTFMRYKSYNVAGWEFRRDMEITWYGRPVLWGIDAYLKGKGSLQITGLINLFSEGETLDQGENLAMWAEAPFTTPSVLALDQRVRWQPVDAYSARLFVPFGDRKDSLRVEFDPTSGLLKRMSGMRHRGEEKTKTPWYGEYSEYRTLHGTKVPHRLVASWEDQRQPYIVPDLEGAEYNVDISPKVPRRTLETS